MPGTDPSDPLDDVVEQTIDVFPYDRAPRTLRRREGLLLSRPVSAPGGSGALWAEAEPIEVVHTRADYQPTDFMPPRYVFQGDHGRIEWQTMNFRQPIYHRNLDVDEMSFQVAGHRTVMTELGTAELVEGDFVRIPAGVCHDNWGREDIHLLWYLPEPLTEQLEPAESSQIRIPPFAGWEPHIANELITDCLGALKPEEQEREVAAHRSDERLILEQAYRETERLAVLRPAVSPSVRSTVLWRGAQVQIEIVDLLGDPGRRYTVHRNADDIQYQVAGTRLLVTQHGAAELRAGDFVRVPAGVAATSIAGASSRHISTLSFHRLPRVFPEYEPAPWWDADQVARYREKVLR